MFDFPGKKPRLRVTEPEEGDLGHALCQLNVIQDAFALNHMSDGNDDRRIRP